MRFARSKISGNGGLLQKSNGALVDLLPILLSDRTSYEQRKKNAYK
jgi:hypothetical protein